MARRDVREALYLIFSRRRCPVCGARMDKIAIVPEGTPRRKVIYFTCGNCHFCKPLSQIINM